MNILYAGKVPAWGYRGLMTLPRRLKLIDTDAGRRLAAEPILTSTGFKPITNGGELPGKAFQLKLRAEGAFEIRLGNRFGEEVRFGLDGNNCIIRPAPNSVLPSERATTGSPVARH